MFCPCEVSQGALAHGVSDPGLCLVSGGLHFRTFDGMTFRLHGRCSYTLAETVPNCPAGLLPFSVKVENEPNRAVFNRITLIAVGHHFGLDRGDWGYVMVSGASLQHP